MSPVRLADVTIISPSISTSVQCTDFQFHTLGFKELTVHHAFLNAFKAYRKSNPPSISCSIWSSSHNVSECCHKYGLCTLAKLFNTLNAELNPICHLLALLAHHFLHVSRRRVKSLTLTLLMLYIYIWSAYS